MPTVLQTADVQYKRTYSYRLREMPKRPTGPFNGRSLTVHNIASIAHQEMLYNGEYKIMYCKFYHVSFCENLQWPINKLYEHIVQLS